jgi:hypothetical protein
MQGFDRSLALLIAIDCYENGIPKYFGFVWTGKADVGKPP